MEKLKLWDLLDFTLIQDKNGVVFAKCLDSEAFRRTVLPNKPKYKRMDDLSELYGT